MKMLVLGFVLVCHAANAETSISASALAPNILSSSNAYYSSPAPPGLIPLGDGIQRQRLDEANTAPTPIPDDNSLILNPNNNPFRQSQEEDPYELNQLLESERENSEGINQSVGPNNFQSYPEKVR